MRTWFLAFACLIAAVHPAHAAFFSDDEARQKIADVQKKVTQLQGQNQDTHYSP